MKVFISLSSADRKMQRKVGMASLVHARLTGEIGALIRGDLQPILEQMEPQGTDGLRVLASYIAS